MYFSAYGAVSAATILQPKQLHEAKQLLTALTVVHVAKNSPFIRESKGSLLFTPNSFPRSLSLS
jgi:hypothetical protein